MENPLLSCNSLSLAYPSPRGIFWAQITKYVIKWNYKKNVTLFIQNTREIVKLPTNAKIDFEKRMLPFGLNAKKY